MTCSSSLLRIVHSSHGKFNHQALARQLYRHDALAGFFTGYPRLKLKDLGVPPKLVHTFPWMEVPYHLGFRFGVMKGGLQREWEWWLYETFDRWVSRHLPAADAYIGLSCASLHAGRAFQRQGGLYFCERHSTHIRTQDQLLADEHARMGFPYQPIDPRVVEKEMEEYAAADAIVVPGEFAYRSFLDWGVPIEKLRKVPLGVDLRCFSKVAEPDPEYFDVLFVGGVSLRKGVPDLFDAFTRLQHPRKRLRIVGAVSGAMREFLLSRYGHPDGVEFLGVWPQPKLREIMSRSHVLVLPSIEDGFGLVLAQALACGCPVIASRNTGAEDLFTDGVEGYIVPIRAPDILAERLQSLVDDSKRRQSMSEAALLGVRAFGSSDQYGDRIVNTVKDLLHARS